MKRIVLGIFLSLAVFQAAAQRRVTVSGMVTDGATGETLLGAGILSGRLGAVTNEYGFYTLTIPGGKTELTWSYIGYKAITQSLDLQKDTTINIQLQASETLQAAMVSAQKDAGIKSTRMGVLEVPINAIKNTPVLFGEADVLKVIQMMPGVQSGSEGFSGLYVRGGGPDENLLLLDGISIYNAEHMLGIFSVFQSEAVKKVTLYKGSFPARYGGRISSIIDVRTNDGNMKEYHGCVGVSAISDKLHIEGPIIKDRTSFSASARGMHTILFDRLIHAFGSPANYYFYDLHGKVTHRFRSGKDRLFLNFYNGLDEFYYKDEQADQETTANTRLSVRWGNLVTALRWNHIFSSKLFSNTTLAYNRYKMVMGTDVHAKGFYGDGTSMMQDVTFDYHSGMRDWSFKTDFDYTPVPQHLIRFGGEYIFHRFVPETVALLMASDGSGNGLDKDYGGEGVRHYGHDASLFFEDDMALGEYFSFNPGLHATLFATEGKAYFSLEPRLSLKYSTPAGIAVKAAYSRMSQYVHLLSSSQMSLPMDLWVPITKDIRPEKSDQGSLGVYFDGLKDWEFSLEGYFKWVDGVLEYKDGVNFMVGTSNWENKVEMGVGRAYGLELYVEKTSGKTTGWLGYTLAKSERRFPGGSISFGQWFPYRYDRRHNLNIVVNHHLTDNIDLGATWSFCTGGTTTMPERQAITADPGGQVKQTDMISHRNNYRLPASHHLNLSANFHRKHRRGESIWNISIYNVYNRMNPNFVFKNLTQRYDPASGSYVKQVELTKLTILPIIPSVGYTYSF